MLVEGTRPSGAVGARSEWEVVGFPTLPGCGRCRQDKLE